ncbi:Pentatricopeptide repeat-containing protein [Cardamine amara subsp. amara]|uniref:Pentatricopeptide repeat-containing protein n=1 Tax=Cardamine amara subsp. amara TaxID=228776 RepID=A0ABD1ACG9_CARAN
MVRILCNRILKSSKSYFRLGMQSSSRCFNSRAQSHNLIITKMITALSPREHTQQNQSIRELSSHAHMANDYYNQSVTIETFDALCEGGYVKEAVQVLDILEDKGYVVDFSRLLGLAKLCGDTSSLEEARVVHDYITPSDVPRSYHTLIRMYFGCGSTDDALNVFDEMPEKNSETWCIVMKGLAKNGEGELAMDMFTRFKAEGNKLDKEIFKAVFFVCGSLGDINEGLLHFEAMYRDYGIVPSMEDYVSVTEMLAACGHLDEALQFVERMTVEPSVEVWETLMNLCWVHGDLELGDRLAELVKKLDASRMNKESNAGLVVAKEKVVKKRQTIRDMRKSPSISFTSGDTSHPESDKTFAALRSLKMQMLDMGFVPATQVCSQDTVEEEEKEEQLLFRSNKLAFAHKMLNSTARSSITVVQNLRTCIDGHNALKMISVITGRELIQRDVKRFHHIKNGVCSCRDYW